MKLIQYSNNISIETKTYRYNNLIKKFNVYFNISQEIS